MPFAFDIDRDFDPNTFPPFSGSRCANFKQRSLKRAVKLGDVDNISSRNGVCRTRWRPTSSMSDADITSCFGESGQTINSERYQRQFSRLSDEMRRARPFIGQGTGRVILQGDNARPRVAKGTKDVICSLGSHPHAAIHLRARRVTTCPGRYNIARPTRTLKQYKRSKKAPATLSTQSCRRFFEGACCKSKRVS